MKQNGAVTGKAITFGQDENLITTTDRKGAITYFNNSFHRISGFDDEELMHKNHNVVRHPGMPTAAFNDLWNTLKSKKSWMGIVKNRAKNGDHYYVDAYVTPITENGEVKEYQSVRIMPEQSFINRAEALYQRINKNKSPIQFWHRLGMTSHLMAGFSIVLLGMLVFTIAIAQPSSVELAGALIIGLGVSWLLSKLIAAPLIKLAKESRQNIDNELSRQVYGGSQSEVAQLRLALHMKMLESNSVLARLDDSSEQLNEIIQRTTQTSQQTSAGVAVQLSEVDQLATAMNEVTATVQEVAQNTSDAAKAAQSADQVVSTGKQNMTKTVQAITQVADDVKQASQVVADLQEESERIGTVLDVIRGIAEQTNLLALNAAIEAARAGEQGRGFAVVADEVRSLAKRTQESTQEIQSMIESMQSGTQNAVAAMATGSQRVEDSVVQANNAGQSLEEIASIVRTISDMTVQIASATEEQIAVSEEINRNVVNISNEAQSNADNSHQTQQTVEQLEEFSSYLQSLIAQFKKID